MQPRAIASRECAAGDRVTHDHAHDDSRDRAAKRRDGCQRASDAAVTSAPPRVR